MNKIKQIYQGKQNNKKYKETCDCSWDMSKPDELVGQAEEQLILQTKPETSKDQLNKLKKYIFRSKN